MRDKPTWLRNRSSLGDADMATMNSYYRARLQALQAVDELVDGLVNELGRMGEADNTYIVYTSDNGEQYGSGTVFWGLRVEGCEVGVRLEDSRYTGFKSDRHNPPMPSTSHRNQTIIHYRPTKAITSHPIAWVPVRRRPMMRMCACPFTSGGFSGGFGGLRPRS